MTGYFGSNFFGSSYWASYYWRAQTVTPPVPDSTPDSNDIGLLERSGREGGFLVPPGMAVFGRFSKEVSNPWQDRRTPYALTKDEREKREIEELIEILDLLSSL